MKLKYYLFIKKSKIGKFTKGDRVVLNSTAGDGDLFLFNYKYNSYMGCIGTITKCRHTKYKVKIDMYPAAYQLKYCPVWFEEYELDFLDIKDIRNYKLEELLK